MKKYNGPLVSSLWVHLIGNFFLQELQYMEIKYDPVLAAGSCYSLVHKKAGASVTSSASPAVVFLQDDVKYHAGNQVDVPMEIPKEVDDVSAFVEGPDGQRVPSTFGHEADGLKHLRFVPKKPGRYQVDVRCRNASVAGSPFLINVVEPKKAPTLQEPLESGARYLVGRELDIAFDAPDAPRDMTCSVEGPGGEDVRSTLEKGNDGYHHAKFVPYNAGTYKVCVWHIFIRGPRTRPAGRIKVSNLNY